MTGPDPSRPIDLTPREREVLAMVAEGKTNREIGTELFISESTAGVHVSNILAKLGVASRTEAAAIAIKSGLFDATPVEAAASEALPEPMYVPPPALVPTGWRARLQAQMRRHPRSTAIVGGSVVVLAAIATGLAFAVLSNGRPTGAAASSSPIAAANGSPTPTATSALDTPTPTPSSSATPSASASASPSASATPSAGPTQAPIAAPTPSPNVTWAVAGSGIGGRTNHTATVLPDDSVLIVGGSGFDIGGSCSASVVRYHQATDRWTDEEPTGMERCEHTATRLLDGSVLVVGGYLNGANAATELFDPVTGAWTPAASMSVPRSDHTATLLPNGRVLVVGGHTGDATTSADSADIYDPVAQTWTLVPGPVNSRLGHTASLLPDGSVLVAGGVRGCCGALASSEIFDPASETWSSADGMTTGRRGASATVLNDGRVLVVGGVNTNGDWVGAAELYDPADDEWTETGPMIESRFAPALAVLRNGRVLAWGSALNADDGSTAETLDPSSGTWRFDGGLPFGLYGDSATLLDDATVLIVGVPDNDLTGAICYTPLDER